MPLCWNGTEALKHKQLGAASQLRETRFHSGAPVSTAASPLPARHDGLPSPLDHGASSFVGTDAASLCQSSIGRRGQEARRRLSPPDCERYTSRDGNDADAPTRRRRGAAGPASGPFDAPDGAGGGGALFSVSEMLYAGLGKSDGRSTDARSCGTGDFV